MKHTATSAGRQVSSRTHRWQVGANMRYGTCPRPITCVPGGTVGAVSTPGEVRHVAFDFTSSGCRRRGGAVALALVAGGRVEAATPSGASGDPLTPIGAFDSRGRISPADGTKLDAGESVVDRVGGIRRLRVAVSPTSPSPRPRTRVPHRARSRQLGERPLPETSNVNWSTNGQTLANLVLTTVAARTPSRRSRGQRLHAISHRRHRGLTSRSRYA